MVQIWMENLMNASDVHVFLIVLVVWMIILNLLEMIVVGVLHGGSAKSCLYEFCIANFRSQPLFVCCKEEGPSHLKL